MVAFTLDGAKYAPNYGGGYEAVGANLYSVVIVNSKDEPTSDRQGVKLILSAQILHGKYRGHIIPMNFNVGNSSSQAMEIAYGQLTAISHLVGLPQGFTNTEQLHNKPFNVYFEVKGLPPRDGKGSGTIVNEAKRFSPFNQNEMQPTMDTEVPPLAELLSIAGGGKTGGFSQNGGAQGFGQPAAQGWTPPGQDQQQPQQPQQPPATQQFQPPAAQQPPQQGPTGGFVPPGQGQPQGQPQGGGFVPPTQGGFTPPGQGQPPQGQPGGFVPPGQQPGGGFQPPAAGANGAPGWQQPR
jgi:hypothetical protein